MKDLCLCCCQSFLNIRVYQNRSDSLKFWLHVTAMTSAFQSCQEMLYIKVCGWDALRSVRLQTQNVYGFLALRWLLWFVGWLLVYVELLDQLIGIFAFLAVFPKYCSWIVRLAIWQVDLGCCWCFHLLRFVTVGWSFLKFHSWLTKVSYVTVS